MHFKVEAACGSFVGNGRDSNQDNFYFNKKHLPKKNKGLKNPLKLVGDTADSVALAVFDGLGGGKNGEEASCRASEIFAAEFKRIDELAVSGKEFMLTYCTRANEAINEISAAKQIGTMGTTVAALYLSHDEAVACNLGDSKIFRIRGNQMMQISEDHTDEKIMSSMGIKKKPVLLQYLGVSDKEMSIDPFVAKGDVQDGDVFVICSDGVTDVVKPQQMYDLIRDSAADEAVRTILAEVNRFDGSDNATIIIVRLKAIGGTSGGN